MQEKGRRKRRQTNVRGGPLLALVFALRTVGSGLEKEALPSRARQISGFEPPEGRPRQTTRVQKETTRTSSCVYFCIFKKFLVVVCFTVYTI